MSELSIESQMVVYITVVAPVSRRAVLRKFRNTPDAKQALEHLIDQRRIFEAGVGVKGQPVRLYTERPY